MVIHPTTVSFKSSSISLPIQSLHCHDFRKEPRYTAKRSQVTSFCCKSLWYITQFAPYAFG